MASRQKAKHKSPNFINAIHSIISKINLTKLVSFFHVNTQKISQYLPKLKPYLPKSKSFILGLFLLSAFTFVTLAAILPGTHIFEGNLIFQEMSFTYNGQGSKLFLQNIKDIKQIENDGIQTLTFTGNFQSQSLPQLNQLNSLQIELTGRESKLIITPANADVSEISLEELLLQPQTKVTGLSYDFYRHQLGFSLFPNPQFTQNNPNTLEIYLGDKPIKVILEGYQLPPSLNLPKQQNNQTSLEFTVNPSNKGLKLELKQNTEIYITLSPPPKSESEQWFKRQQWFREKIATKDVKFIQVDKSTGDHKNYVEISTIVEGKIRMVEQEREIKENQFLLGENPNKPLNIQLIRNLQLIPNKQGIEARFSGTTKQIQIGLDKDFPVSKIQGSWLDGVLPRDVIIALFSFGAATIANLLPWLFSSTSKSQSDADNK